MWSYTTRIARPVTCCTVKSNTSATPPSHRVRLPAEKGKTIANTFYLDWWLIDDFRVPKMLTRLASRSSILFLLLSLLHNILLGAFVNVYMHGKIICNYKRNGILRCILNSLFQCTLMFVKRESYNWKLLLTNNTSRFVTMRSGDMSVVADSTILSTEKLSFNN